MKHRDFIRHLDLGAGGGILIAVGLSGCVVAPAVKPQEKPRHRRRPPYLGSAGSLLSYGSPLQRPHASGDGKPRMIVVFLRGEVDGLNVVVAINGRSPASAHPATPGQRGWG